MRYEGQIYRPPSEADAYILQATIGCSWNHCTYCDMYRSKAFRVRALDETLEDIRAAGSSFGANVTKSSSPMATRWFSTSLTGKQSWTHAAAPSRG